MPQVRRSHSAPANATSTVDITPFQRFGLGGGGVNVKMSAPTGGAVGDVLGNLTLGSDQVSRDNAIDIRGVVDQFTIGFGGVGAPSDPITVTIQNTTVAAILVDVVVDIQNVA